MIRVVLDTNIVVSALLQPLGSSARILVLALSDALQLSVSGNIYAEYEEVIRRPRFRFDSDVIAAILEAIRLKGIWIKPTEAIRVCLDPDDDIFVECASAARAGYLITGNTKDFPPAWSETMIVTPRRFLEIEFSEGD
jgi:uncharacterized protein